MGAKEILELGRGRRAVEQFLSEAWGKAWASIATRARKRVRRPPWRQCGNGKICTYNGDVDAYVDATCWALHKLRCTFWRRSSKEMHIARAFINRDANFWKTHKNGVHIFKACIKPRCTLFKRLYNGDAFLNELHKPRCSFVNTRKKEMHNLRRPS